MSRRAKNNKKRPRSLFFFCRSQRPVTKGIIIIIVMNSDKSSEADTLK